MIRSGDVDRRQQGGRAWLLVTLAVASVSCSSSNAPSVGDASASAADAATADAAVACVSGLSADCTSLYDPPSFDTIFTAILQPNCATGTGTCHTADARMGGLAFVTADESYALLQTRVVAGNPGCSLLMERLESTDPNFHMPPGDLSIAPGQDCAIVQWITNGAPR